MNIHSCIHNCISYDPLSSSESSDGSRLRCFWLFFSFILLTRFVSSDRWRDLQWLWMLSWQCVWVFFPFRAFFDYPFGNLGVDQSKLSLESPSTRITWHLKSWTIRFDSYVRYCSDGTMYPSLLSHRTSVVAAALLIYKNAVKSCVFSSYCSVVCCDFCCFVWCNFYCFIYAFSFGCKFWLMTYVTLAASL